MQSDPEDQLRQRLVQAEREWEQARSQYVAAYLEVEMDYETEVRRSHDLPENWPDPPSIEMVERAAAEVHRLRDQLGIPERLVHDGYETFWDPTAVSVVAGATPNPERAVIEELVAIADLKGAPPGAVPHWDPVDQARAETWHQVLETLEARGLNLDDYRDRYSVEGFHPDHMPEYPAPQHPHYFGAHSSLTYQRLDDAVEEAGSMLEQGWIASVHDQQTGRLLKGQELLDAWEKQLEAGRREGERALGRSETDPPALSPLARRFTVEAFDPRTEAEDMSQTYSSYDSLDQAVGDTILLLDDGWIAQVTDTQDGRVLKDEELLAAQDKYLEEHTPPDRPLTNHEAVAMFNALDEVRAKQAERSSNSVESNPGLAPPSTASPTGSLSSLATGGISMQDRLNSATAAQPLSTPRSTPLTSRTTRPSRDSGCNARNGTVWKPSDRPGAPIRHRPV